MKCIVILLVFLSFTAFTAAQQCVGGCDAGLSVCGGINYQLYINGTTKAQMTSIETSILKLIYSMRNFGESACEAALHVFMCNNLHPGCDASNPTPTPVAPCMDMCLNFRKVCGAFLPLFPPIMVPYLNCTGVNSKTGQSLYSTDNDTCTRVTTRVSNCTNAPPSVLPYTGACQTFLGSKMGKVGNLCAPFVTNKVYVPFDWPLAQFAVATRGGLFDAVEGGKPIFPYGCYKRLLATRCQVSFPPCTDVQVPDYNNVTVGIYPRPCVNICEEVVDYCKEFFVDIGLTQLIYNCTARYFASVTNYTTVVTTKTSYTLPCYKEYINFPGAIGTYNFTDVICPNSTGRKKDAKDDSMANDRLPLCGLKCPDGSYSDDEWKTLVSITRIGSSLSLAAMSFLILSYLLQYERRQFPVILHIWEFIATAGFALSFLIGGRRPQESTWCYDAGTSANQTNNSTCAAQGFLFIFFGLSLSVWCASIAFSMFYGIVLGKKVQELKSYHFVFHILSWSIPLIFAIAAIASESIGYGPPLAWCFIHFAGFGYGTGLSRDYPIFYMGEGVLFVIILVFFVATVIKIVQVQKSSSYGPSKMATHSRTFMAQIRLLIFIFVVGIICFSIFEWRLQVDGDDKKTAVGIKWTMCKVKHEVKLATKADAGLCDGDVNPSRINYRHTAFESFLLSGIGILIFIAFGSDVGIYKHWVKLAKLLFGRRWRELVDFVKLGHDPFPNSQNTVLSNKITNKHNNTGTGTGTSGTSNTVSVQASSTVSSDMGEAGNSLHTPMYD